MKLIIACLALTLCVISTDVHSQSSAYPATTPQQAALYDSMRADCDSVGVTNLNCAFTIWHYACRIGVQGPSVGPDLCAKLRQYILDNFPAGSYQVQAVRLNDKLVNTIGDFLFPKPRKAALPAE